MTANPANTRVPYTLGQVLLLMGDRAGARAVMGPLRHPRAEPLLRAGECHQEADGGDPAVMRWLAVGLTLAAVPSPVPAQSSSYEELQRFSAVLNHIRSNYPDSVTYRDLVRAAVDGMLRSLDPHSWFATREDYERLDALERGELAETGIVLELADGVPTVLSSYLRSPAEKAGVLPGDRLLRIDRMPVAGMTAKAMALRLAGEKGSKVEVSLERGPALDPDTFSVTLKRAFLEGGSVSVVRMVDPTTGYIRLEQFGPEAASEVGKAIRRLQDRKARRLILDLRGNPGGIVTEAVELASEFLPAGTLVFSTRGKKKAVSGEFRTKRSGDFVDLPLVLLIDEGSASASKALADSLQDYDRAVVVGRRSFGKALVQTGFYVPSGVVQLTVGHVITPSGRSHPASVSGHGARAVLRLGRRGRGRGGHVAGVPDGTRTTRAGRRHHSRPRSARSAPNAGLVERGCRQRL
jgi:carboxyl-terminal processing protease